MFRNFQNQSDLKYPRDIPILVLLKVCIIHFEVLSDLY